jgi:sugar fermentation stimulation protein A
MLLLKYKTELNECNFVKRYKRFFVDVKTQEQNILTVHCANSGSMKSCLIENATAYILDSMNPQRKLRYTLELLQLEDGLACINTARANQFVEQILFKTIGQERSNIFLKANFPYESFSKWEAFKREAVFNKETRFDFCLRSLNQTKKCWIEVKSVSMRMSKNIWAFPDAITERGQKHLVELMNAKKSGNDAWLFFVLMRGNDIPEAQLHDGFRTAYEIDPQYSNLLENAKKVGVNVALIIPEISVEGFSLRKFFILN